MLKVKPRFDAAIVVRSWGIGIHFAQIPDAEIVAQIIDLTKNNGIILDEDPYDACGYPLDDSNASSTHKEPAHRLYYWLKISPVFDILGLARLLSNYLEDIHRLSVRLINEIPPGDHFIKQTFVENRRIGE